MNLTDYAKAQSLSARLAKITPSKKKVISPIQIKPKTLSQQIAEITKHKQAPKPIIVEKRVYMGKPGDKGEKGDRGEKGKDGHDGKNGIDGKTPIKGTDYFNPEEIEAIKKELLANIPEVKDGKTPEINNDFVKEIVQRMHSLPEKDKLEVSKGIRNASSFIYGGNKYQVSELMHGGGYSNGNGGVGTWYNVSGTIDGVNDTFTIPVSPTSDIILNLSGQIQVNTKWYVLSGNTITYQAGYIPADGISEDEHKAFVIS